LFRRRLPRAPKRSNWKCRTVYEALAPAAEPHLPAPAQAAPADGECHKSGPSRRTRQAARSGTPRPRAIPNLGRAAFHRRPNLHGLEVLQAGPKCPKGHRPDAAFGVRRPSAATTALWPCDAGPPALPSESGVALRWPSHSTTRARLRETPPEVASAFHPTRSRQRENGAEVELRPPRSADVPSAHAPPAPARRLRLALSPEVGELPRDPHLSCHGLRRDCALPDKFRRLVRPRASPMYLQVVGEGSNRRAGVLPAS
jgi:hypothetical protein